MSLKHQFLMLLAPIENHAKRKKLIVTDVVAVFFDIL